MPPKIPLLSSAVGYDLAAKKYDEKTAYLNSFEKGGLLNLFPADLSGWKILDVGAGTGRMALSLSQRGAVVTAVDVSEKMLAVLKKKNPRIQSIVGKAEALPFVAESFDAVVAAFLIVHLKDCAVFFDEVYRVLKPGGLFIFSNINQKEPPPVKTSQGQIKIESYYHRPEKVREQVAAALFVVEKDVMIKEGEVWVNQLILAKK